MEGARLIHSTPRSWWAGRKAEQSIQGVIVIFYAEFRASFRPLPLRVILLLSAVAIAVDAVLFLLIAPVDGARARPKQTRKIAISVGEAVHVLRRDPAPFTRLRHHLGAWGRWVLVQVAALGERVE